MANSMIPYSFIPGTKAKASEVNAKFIALADKIDTNKAACDEDVSDIYEAMSTKAEKTELINEHTVTEADTDLDDYKTKGTYIFSSLYTPENIPQGTSGMLIVTGDDTSVIKQIWYCDGENPEIFTRNFTNESWSSWYAISGVVDQANPGYLQLTNGLLLQWGGQKSSSVTYPIAFKVLACPVLTKQGYSVTAERSDGGIISQSLTGFNFGSNGAFAHMNWIAIGY